MQKKNIDQTNKHERDREIHHTNKDNWPIRRENLSHVTIMQNGHLPAHQNLSHPSSMVLILSKYL